MTTDGIPPLAVRTAIVTGANSGLGFQVARRLAAAGADVTLAVRSIERGEDARRQILAESPDASLRVAELDVASLAAVRRFAGERLTDGQPIDLLVANAGIMAVPRRVLSADGFEIQFATNYLGHFALIGQLLPLLRASSGARVVTLSSLAARMGRIDFDNLQGERRYGAWSAYGTSKLADLMLAIELDRRSRAAGWGITAVAAHPGISPTGLSASGPEAAGADASPGPGERITSAVADVLLRLPFASQSPEQGARPILHAATSQDIIGGGFYGPSGFLELTGPPAPASISRAARDVSVARRLWAHSEELSGVYFPEA
ncbi:MAG TPA: SDR family oxidoreductase [Thermomicrobiales bacterium]|jgi:NAD(P)-dependent dehydrogenase (short-subunit alcohol dehydrogenase family)|nr:SDR family oxidoreductase [Thermomicrobiales bacterium]